ATSSLDGYGLRGHTPARPAPHASHPLLVHRLVLLLHASFRPRLATTPSRFAIASPSSGCEEDFHLQAVEHARHTQEKPAPPGAGYIVHRGRLLPDQAVVNSHAGTEIPACSGAVRTATARRDIGEVRAKSHVAVDQRVLRVAAGLEASRVVNDSSQRRRSHTG